MDASRRRAACVWLAVLCACGRQAAPPKGLNMKFSEIRFSLPAGVIDQTAYTFASEEKDVLEQEEVTFDRDRLPDGVRDLGGLVKYRVDRLRGVTPGEVETLEDVPAQFGSTPARRIRVEQKAGGKSIQTLCLLAILSDGTYLQVTYTAPRGDQAAAQRLDYMAGSVRPAGAEAGTARTGFTRRSVGVVTMEVPSHLRPPSQYLFLLPGDAGSLQMTVWRLGDPNPIGPLSAQMASDAALAEHMGPSAAQTVGIAGGTADFLRYTFTKKRFDAVQEYAVWRARIQFAGGTVASATVRSPGPFRAPVDSLFTAFVTSLREE